MTSKIKKGDKVKIMAGKDRGREGVVEKVFPKDSTVLIPGVNIYKKHSKYQSKKRQKGIIEIARPLAVAKVALLCPKCKQVTRVGFQQDKDKDKVRICRKCREVI